ncbi:CapA family protein [Ralstonia pickettii]|nr:CapA family protein [Ralstonia pickettii]
MRRERLLVIGIVLFILVLTACSSSGIEVVGSNKENSEVEYTLIDKEKFPEYIIDEITISSIGDILIHEPVFNDAASKKGYDFSPMLEKVKPYLRAATITTANQESMIGGAELGLSSYPQFNSPAEVGDALKEAGVDAVTLANNHTLDRGEAAVQNAIRHWETIDMTYVGAYKDIEDSEEIRTIETEEGVSAAILAYTYGTNGIPVPEGKDYLVNLIDLEKMAEDIARAKKAADVVILNLHFGNEYERMPNKEQKELVQFAADEGVHAVIGHHPHVLQPAAWVEGKEGNQTLVIYSLGNFLSNQQELYQRIGGVFNFTVTKKTYGDRVTIELHSPAFIPTYVTFNPNYSDYKVVPMYTLTDKELPKAAQHYEEIKAHMAQWLPELVFPESE